MAFLSILLLFFYPSLPKVRHPHPVKNTFLKLARQRLSLHRILILSLKFWLCRYLRFIVFGQIMPNDSQKHLSDKRLAWKDNKKYLVHLTISESLKSLQNFKSVRIRVLEVMGRYPSPLEYKVWITKYLSVGKLKRY